ncbi:MAG: prepilin-type N-terminal cleavage/methylation domain-containing protein [candidate division Zixibacteria bacterium]|nr:prepilin-type N-terminal cleavage/methylation domain-containing protein [candidate division Zixibacteria bacterium]
MKISDLRNQKGLTLLEVLIAMVILGIALLMLLNMSMVALTSNDWSNKATIVTQAIQKKLEELRSTPNPVSGIDSLNGVNLYWSVSSPQNHLREVYLSASWEDLTSEYKNTSVTTYIQSDSV